MDNKNTFMIGGWVAPPPTKKNYITLCRCGLNTIFLVGKDNEKYSIAKRHLTSALKAGVSVFLGGKNDLSLIATEGRRFKNFGNVAGVNVYDEPIFSQKEEIISALKRLKKANKNREFFINLLPSYSPIEALGGSFKRYIETYAEIISRIEKGAWLSFDYYPIVVDNGKPALCKAWISDVDIVANVAKKYGLKPHFFLQSMSFGGVISKYHDRKPTLEDIRLQVFVYLSFGAQGVTHFCYQSPVSPEFNETQTGLIINGKKTDRWNFAKKINFEIKALEKDILALKWQGCHKISGKNGDISAFSGIVNYDLTNCSFLKSAKSDENMLLGIYEGNGKEGYILVNFADTSKEVKAKVKLRFKFPVTLTVYRKGIKKAVKASGLKTFTLEKGEGLFIVAENA